MASASDIARVRRMTAEPTTATYADADIEDAIERYPCMDVHGQAPYVWTAGVGQTPPIRAQNPVWVETYDLNAAAADVWEEKAAALAHLYDFSADGGQYSRAQMVAQARATAARYRAIRSPKTLTLIGVMDGTIYDADLDVD